MVPRNTYPAMIGFSLIILLLPLGAQEDQNIPLPQGQTIYQDYINSAQSWSDTKTSDTPNVGKIRGPFHSQTVTVQVDRLPAHQWVKVSFNLLVRGTWDGSSNIWGPDLWSLTSRGGPRLIFASICNMGDWALHDKQSFPDDYTAPVSYRARTGSADTTDDLNSYAGVHSGRYTTYPIVVVFPHTGDSVTLDLAGIYDDPEDEQAWGVNSFSIETSTAAPTSNASLPKLWDALASPDPLMANDAVWRFVGAGDSAIRFLQEKLSELQAGTEPSPKLAAGDAQKNLGLRLRRADRIARILEGPHSSALCFGFDQFYPEYD
jgi:hypothetical protein